jgi:hypothetical protein
MAEKAFRVLALQVLEWKEQKYGVRRGIVV